MTSDSTLISLLGILLALPSAALPVSAQSPAAPPAAPPAAAAPASTEPSRASVEKIIPELKSYLATREVSMTRLADGPVKLEWVYDSAWRFYPVEPDPSARQNGPIKCSLPLLPMETVT